MLRLEPETRRVVVGPREALDYFYRLMGADHLLFGSDHPFGQPYSMVAEMVEQLDCTSAEKEMIYHGNAEGLLGIS